MLGKLLKSYLLAFLLVVHVGAFVGVLYVLDDFAPSHRWVMDKRSERAIVDARGASASGEPSARYSDHVLDGEIRREHPRILLPLLSALSSEQRTAFFKRRNQLYRDGPIKAPPLPCNQTHLSALTTCWLTTGNSQKFARAVQELLKLNVVAPEARARYGNGWQLALNYDLLASSGELTKSQDRDLQHKLEAVLIGYLRLLDGDSASLWHGRLSLAANAWLCAVVLEPGSDDRRKLIARAQGHFLETVRSVGITEAWPEGYSYWINSRGFYFALAASAYINAMRGSRYTDEIKHVLERVGLWHVYATRPDNQIQGFADEGPRVDLKDETRRVIDVIAAATGNQQLARYSLYLQNLHGRASYFGAYRWGFHLFNDPELLPAAASGAFEEFDGWLPEVELFGRDGSNALYVRSHWGPNATFLTYRAGHSFTHHGHYDAGHFTLFKGHRLVVNSSQQGKFTGENRLNYSLRTVAKNSLLIQRPGEEVKPNRFFTVNVADGGQRMTLPTGSALTSVRHWRSNLYKDQHLEGAQLEQYSNDPEYVYIQSNLTPAYNNTDYDETGAGGKVTRVTRALFYLKNEDVLIVHDRIATTNPAYRTKWLLHSLGKPRVDSEELLHGAADNGILRSTSRHVLIEQQSSSLKAVVLLPQEPTLHMVGGKDFRYYVEIDGDDATLDGKNMSADVRSAPWSATANWRTEIFSSAPGTEQRFLVALAPSAKGRHPIDATLLETSSKDLYGALVGSTAVVLAEPGGQYSMRLPAAATRVFLVDPSKQPGIILLNGNVLRSNQQADSVTQVLLPHAAGDKHLQVHYQQRK